MSGTITVDEPLLRRMARDASVYSLTRPWAVVMWVALVAALVTSILNVVDAAADAGALTSWLPVAVIALGAYAVWLTVANARWAVRTAMPPGTKVWAEVSDAALRIGAGRRVSEVPFTEFQSLRAGRDAVLLRIRGTSVATAVPRSLLSDADVEALRAGIG